MLGMTDKLSEMGMKRAVQAIDPADHPLFQSLADVISSIEYEQAQAISQCVDAADMDIPVQHDREKRRRELLDIAEATAEQDLAPYWFAEVVDIEAPEQAAEYVGYDGQQWRDQLETWYEQYRQMGVVDAPLSEANRADLGHIAAMHVQESFGLELDEFVAGVINWDRGMALETLLAGPIRSYTGVITQLADEIEHRERRIEELEARVQELESET